MKNCKYLIAGLLLLLVAVPACAFWPFSSSEKIQAQVKIEMSVNGNKPIATLKTNLPEGTELLFGIAKDDDVGSTIEIHQKMVSVQDGTAVSLPFSDEGKALPGGKYVFFVLGNDWNLQPANVQKAIKDFDLNAPCFNAGGNILNYREKPFTLPNLGKNEYAQWLALCRWRPKTKEEVAYSRKVLAMYDELIKLKSTKQFKALGFSAASKNAVNWKRRLEALRAELSKKDLLPISIEASYLYPLALDYAEHRGEENEFTNDTRAEFEIFKACVNAK